MRWSVAVVLLVAGCFGDSTASVELGGEGPREAEATVACGGSVDLRATVAPETEALITVLDGGREIAYQKQLMGPADIQRVLEGLEGTWTLQVDRESGGRVAAEISC